MLTEEIKARARSLADEAIIEIRTSGNLYGRVVILSPDGREESIPFDADSPQDKTRIGDAVRKRVNEAHAEAVFLVTDAWVGKFAQTSEGVRNRMIHQALNLSVRQSAAAGLCEAQEQVLVSAEAVGDNGFVVMQPYLRHPDNSKEVIVMDRIEQETMPMQGRLGGWFGTEKGTPEWKGTPE